MGESREARYWHLEEGRVVCTACPRCCALAEGQRGFCAVRMNERGRLISLVYGRPSSVAVDPIEKKPLFHFLPGTSILSLGTAGCNLGCRFCQNWELSRARADLIRSMALPPSEIPQLARDEGCLSVAFTYNEPTVFVEYALDAARACREAGLATVAVTAGYIGAQARQDLYAQIDAANIDLKGFSESFYQKLTLGHLAPVLETIEDCVRRGVWVELTTLLIPGFNDSDQELAAEASWIVERLGTDIPLHFTAFHPSYQMMHEPRTPALTLRRARDLARAAGLRYVYTGNISDPEGETTRCHACQAVVIERRWHAVAADALAGTGKCPSCGAHIPGVFGPKAQEGSTGQGHPER